MRAAATCPSTCRRARTMTLYHAGQVVLLVVVLALAIDRVRAICYRGAIDAASLRRALMRLVRAGEDARASALALAARPALAVEPALALLDPAVPDDERMSELDERLLELEHRAMARLRTLRILATIGSALGFLGAFLEIHWVFAGDHGLLGLQAGLVESIGLSRAFLSIALGIATSTLAIGAYGAVSGRARATIADGRRLVGSLEEALEKRGPGPSKEEP